MWAFLSRTRRIDRGYLFITIPLNDVNLPVAGIVKIGLAAPARNKKVPAPTVGGTGTVFRVGLYRNAAIGLQPVAMWY